LEVEVGGIEAHHLPLVAAAETTRDSQDLQATAAATAVAGEELGREREESERGFWSRLVKPTQDLAVGLDPARWARLANGPRPSFSYLKIKMP
jgi:hypothetical protein